ncbi:MAG: hypothetical protein ABH950_03800, partial [Candidatus Altiarchaeota archaeon]
MKSRLTFNLKVIFLSTFILFSGCIQDEPQIQRQIPTTTSVENELINPGEAKFTGNYTVYGIDPEGDGFFNQLGIEVELQFLEPGFIGFIGHVSSGESLLTSRESYQNSMFFAASASSHSTGLKNVSFEFSGQDIYEEGIDGVYSINLVLFGREGVFLDNASFKTPYFNHTQFREVSAQLFGVSSENTYDEDKDGFFDRLDLKIETYVITPGNYSLQGLLKTSDSWFGEMQSPLVSAIYHGFLDQGVHNVTLSFDGRKMNIFGLDCPCSVWVDLQKQPSTHLDSLLGNLSQNYSHSDFQHPFVEILNSHNFVARDFDGDGRQDSLIAEIMVNTTKSDDYEIDASLHWSVPQTLEDGGSGFIRERYYSFDNLNNRKNISLQEGVNLIPFTVYLLTSEIKTGFSRSLAPCGMTIPEDALFSVYVYEGGSLPGEEGIVDLQMISPESWIFVEGPIDTSIASIIKDSVTDEGVDEYGSEQFERLKVSIDVSVFEPGNYTLTGFLADGPEGDIFLRAEESFIHEAGTEIKTIE